MLFLNTPHKKFYNTYASENPSDNALIYLAGLVDEIMDRAKICLSSGDFLREDFFVDWMENYPVLVFLAFDLSNSHLSELHPVTITDVFSSELAPYFYQAIKLRFPNELKFSSGNIGRPSVYSDKDILKMRDLRLKGCPYAEIARRTGASKGTVIRLLKNTEKGI